MARNIFAHLYSIRRRRLFFFGGFFTSRVDAGLGVEGGSERRSDVDAQGGIDHGVLSLFQILLRFGDINLMPSFGYISEHPDHVVVNFEEAPADGDAVAMIFWSGESQRADTEHGKQRRVIRQHADIAVLGWSLRAHRFLARQ